jgi:hypothetical protein
MPQAQSRMQAVVARPHLSRARRSFVPYPWSPYSIVETPLTEWIPPKANNGIRCLPKLDTSDYPEVIHLMRLLRSSRGPLVAILPLFPRRLQLPIPLGENLLLMPAEHVPWRVSDGAVQTGVVVVVYVTLNQTARV